MLNSHKSNQGFVAGFDPFAAGIYTIQMDQYNLNGGLEASVAINVGVTTTRNRLHGQ